MLTRQQKIDAIYEKIANKELEFWCWLDSGRNDWYLLDTSRYLVEKSEWKYELYESYTNNKITDIVKIIWHPVMIGDVMDFLNEKIRPYWLSLGDGEFYYAEWENTAWMIDLWENKRKPIEEQSDECVGFIYNLISKQWEK